MSDAAPPGDLARLRRLPPARLVEALRADQAARWRAGDRVPAEAYFDLFPDLLAAREDALVLITGEILLAHECGPPPASGAFRARFPQFADALDAQFALHRGLAPPPVVKPRPQTADDLAALLQKRLRFLAGLTAVFAAYVLLTGVLPGVLRGYPFSRADLGMIGILVVQFGVACTLTAVLARRASLRTLRAAEVVLFGLGLAYLSARAAWTLLDDRYPLAALLQLGEPSSYLTSRLLHAACSNAAIPFLVLLVGYGILIPNPWPRCAAVVAAMALTPVGIWAAANLAAGTPPAAWVRVLVTHLLPVVGTTAAVAVYGSHRIEVLRRAAEAGKVGPYRLVRRLGRGGMGEVWLAEHELLRRPCAVKLIRPERAGDPTTFARFEREVRATVALNHPNTVRVYDYGQAEDGTFYYVMEYLEGQSLQALVERDGPLPPARVVALLRQVCRALREAHAAGLTHRDVTPGNILVATLGGEHDVAKLLDFGLVQGAAGEPAGKLTQTGAVAGTPAFMSPEQAAGGGPVDGRSDLYSLGAVAYFLLAGRPPFVRPTAVEVMAAHLTDAPEPPPGPAELRAVVLRCLEKRPEWRYADAAALEAALAGCGGAVERPRPDAAAAAAYNDYATRSRPS